jgi:hypothetical protein
VVFELRLNLQGFLFFTKLDLLAQAPSGEKRFVDFVSEFPAQVASSDGMRYATHVATIIIIITRK